jgi:hypothetical protein
MLLMKNQLGVLGTEYYTIVSNEASTGTIAIDNLIIANVQGSTVEVDLHLVRDGVAHSIMSSFPVTTGKSFMPFLGKNSQLYINSGDLLEARCDTEGGAHFLCSWSSNDLPWIEVYETFTYEGTTITLSDYFEDGPKRAYTGTTGEELVVPDGYDYAVFISSNGEVYEEVVTPGEVIQFQSAIIVGKVKGCLACDNTLYDVYLLVTGAGPDNQPVYTCCPSGSTGIFPPGDPRQGRCCNNCSSTSSEQGTPGKKPRKCGMENDLGKEYCCPEGTTIGNTPGPHCIFCAKYDGIQLPMVVVDGECGCAPVPN